VPDEGAADFVAFHLAHPQVYATFVALARESNARGARHGARTLWEVCRYSLSAGGLPPLHLDDAMMPHYVRAIMGRERDLDGYFRTRTARGAGEGTVYNG
jgi:hypothetical protein